MRQRSWRQIGLALLGMGVGLAMTLLPWVGPVPAQTRHPDAALPLPPAQVHPLPPSLADWVSAAPDDHYFDQVQATRVGYLVWSQFPVGVVVAPAAIEREAVQWESAVEAAIADWQPYLPLVRLTTPQTPDVSPNWLDNADIVIEQTRPQLGQGRARSAETRFSLYIDKQGRLAHRCTIYIRPSQTQTYTNAAVRHELGHALGIWGHSPLETDALYFAQVREPAPISERDVNTLKQVYQQPTHLGWSVISPDQNQPHESEHKT